MSWPSHLYVRPISSWPTTRTPAADRVSSPFRASLRDTLELLDRELWQIGAIDVSMEIAVPPGGANWRLDGNPRADARPDHPGIVLAFHSTVVQSGRELRYATDRFTTWPANLRAIALGLEALRKVERYGIANRGEQYAGWAQLTAGGPDPVRGRRIIEQLGSVAAALRATHPDTRDDGYTDADFANVQAARGDQQ